MKMNKYIPEFGIIETTLACNFNCIHCGSHAGVKRDSELSLEELDNLFKDLKELGCKAVSYMGGEFFLRKDWKDILELTNKYGFIFSIATNGYFLNDKIFKTLKSLGVASISFSLDSADEQTHDKLRGTKGAYKRVLKNIRKSCEYGIPTAVYTAINKQNACQLEAILKLLLDTDLNLLWKIILTSAHNKKFDKKYQIDKETFVYTAKFISENKKKYNTENSKLTIEESHDIGYCSEIYPNLSAIYSKTGCIGGIRHFGIQSNGNVKGCLSLQDDFIEGNIREKSFREIWKDKNSFSYSRKFNKKMLKGICKTCDKALSDECKGGCRDFAHSATGSMFNTPFCLHNIEQNDNIR